MDAQILDDGQTGHKEPISISTVITIGMLVFLAVSGLGALVDLILNDVFIVSGISAVSNFLLRGVSVLACSVAATAYAMRQVGKLLNGNKAILKSIIYPLGLFFLATQIAQFAYGFGHIGILPASYFEQLDQYLADARSLRLIETGDAVMEFVQYALIALFIWKSKIQKGSLTKS